MTLFGREYSWSWWMILAVGAGIGLIDESIKVLLPTREFDVVDLMKDWVGVARAVVVIQIIERRPITFENNSREAGKE